MCKDVKIDTTQIFHSMLALFCGWLITRVVGSGFMDKFKTILLNAFFKQNMQQQGI